MANRVLGKQGHPCLSTCHCVSMCVKSGPDRVLTHRICLNDVPGIINQSEKKKGAALLVISVRVKSNTTEQSFAFVCANFTQTSGARSSCSDMCPVWQSSCCGFELSSWPVSSMKSSYAVVPNFAHNCMPVKKTTSI